jgi:AraC family transcriptional regulator of adaptative response/methylated-DNA-[protein]-cysteine methyltransferase
VAKPARVIEYDFCATPFGECLVARTARGLCRIDFTDGDPQAALARLRGAHPGPRLRRAELAALAGEVFAADGPGRLPVDAGGTPFQREVWAALRRIPRGATCSYGALAARLGRPGAARAVGQALARNPLAVLVPCHRVLPAGGGPGAYRWGSARKSALLDWEAAATA